MLEGVDVSYAQQNYRPGGESFVIVNASRANIGLAVGSYYTRQVANARAAGKHVGHYFFNGNVNPVVCADYFVANLSYRPGDSLWLDVEAEPGTGTAAWTPAQALAFINRVRAHGLPTPGVYLNRSLMDGSNWSAVVATGAPLWIAYYNPSPPPIKWWPTWTVWQYTSVPIDRNKAQGTLTAAVSVSPTVEEDDMPKYQIIPDSTNKALYLTGPGIAYHIPDSNAQAVLTKWASAVNAGKAPSLTVAQWAMVSAVLNPAAPAPDATPIVNAVVAAIKANGTPVDISDAEIAAIAKAVNDDAAKRLTS